MFVITMELCEPGQQAGDSLSTLLENYEDMNKELGLLCENRHHVIRGKVEETEAG